MTSEKTSAGLRIRLAPKHMLAIPAFLALALVFGKEFEGITGLKLAGVQLIAAAVGCMMYMLSAIMVFVWLTMFDRFATDDRRQKLFSFLRIRPLYLQQFIRVFAFFGRSLLLAAVEFFLLATVFPPIVPREELALPIFVFCLVPLSALCHLVVEWKSTSGFLDCINSDRKQ